MRRAVIDRRTAETQIRFALNVDGTGTFDNQTGIRFLDHMLDLVARHGGFDLAVKATGDLDVDQHHTVEDVGIAFGEAVAVALGNKRGINRAGYFEEVGHELALQIADQAHPHLRVDHRVRTAAQVDGHDGQRLVHRHHEVAGAVDAPCGRRAPCPRPGRARCRCLPRCGADRRRDRRSAVTARSNAPWRATRSSMWSRKRTPVWLSKRPRPSSVARP